MILKVKDSSGYDHWINTHCIAQICLDSRGVGTIYLTGAPHIGIQGEEAQRVIKQIEPKSLND